MNSENRTITILISSKGATKIETHGFSGPACQSASKFIEEALGKRNAEQLKSAFYQTTVNHEQELQQ